MRRFPPQPPESPRERLVDQVFRWGWLAVLLVVFASLATLLNFAFCGPGPRENTAPVRLQRGEAGARLRIARDQRGAQRVQARGARSPGTDAASWGPPFSLSSLVSRLSPPLVLAAEREPPVMAPGFRVGDEFGGIEEPPMAVLQSINGQETVKLRSLLEDTPAEYRKDENGNLLPVPPPIDAPVTILKLVQPFAKRSKRGNCCGWYALQLGRRQPRNSVFYRNPRVACAAYTAAVLRHCGRPNGSFSATAQYGQLRRWGGKLVATRMSTKYLPYLKYLQAGDYIFFHKGSRFGHLEVYVGKGLVSGTSSSQGRVGIRRLANRGYAQCSVVRF